MSRPDRRIRNDQVVGTADDSSARLFAFSNFTRGYKVVYAPPNPVIVLRTKKAKAGQHPCAQWEPLAESIFQRDPLSHATYVLDTTPLGTVAHSTEDTASGALGPVMKSAGKMVARLHPENGTLLGAGSTATLVFKYAVFTPGTCEGMISNVVLVAPEGLAPCERLLKQAAKHASPSAALPRLTVLETSPERANQWTASGSLASMLSIFFSSVEAKVIDRTKPLFQFVATITTEKTDAPKDYSRSDILQLHHIQFMLSRYTKQIEQEIEPAFLEDGDVTASGPSDATAAPSSATAPPPAKHADPSEDTTSAPSVTEAAEGDASSTMRPFAGKSVVGDSANMTAAGPSTWEGVLIKPKLLGNSQGTVELSQPPMDSMGRDVPAGTYARLVGTLQRDANGTTRLMVDSSSAAESLPDEIVDDNATLCCRPAEVPQVHLSGVRHRVGCALIRGRKIVLANGSRHGTLEFPSLPHSDNSLSAVTRAVAAVCSQCDITEDNLAVHPFMAPVTFYPTPANKDGPLECVTLYIAVATYEPPGGKVRDVIEDEPNPADGYEWVSAGKALGVLETKAEREALQEVVAQIKKAHAAGIYRPNWGLGVFGEPVAAASSDPSATQRTLLVVTNPFGLPIDPEKELVARGIVPAVDHVRPVGAEDEDLLSVEWLQALLGDNPAAAATLPDGMAAACLLLDPDYDFRYAMEDLLPPLCGQHLLKLRVVTHLGGPNEMRLLSEPFNGAVRGETHLVTQARAGIEVSDAVSMCEPVSEAASFVFAINPEAARFESLAHAALGAEQAGIMGAVVGAPRVEIVKYQRRLPFDPEKLFKLTTPPELEAALAPTGALLLQAQGDCWLSTRFAYRGVFLVSGPAANITQGDPWWCCMAEADRPGDADPSTWDKQHGDRMQDLDFVVRIMDPSLDREAIEGRVGEVLDALLCKPEEARFWQRKKDPFPEWIA